MASTRRQVLTAGGALTVAIALPWRALADAPPAPMPVSAFIRVPEKGPVVLVMPRVEMGQGVYTSLAMLLAEELEIGLDQVKLEPAPPNPDLYSDPVNGEQVTGTSATTLAWYQPLREAGARARMMLIVAAAQRWGVKPQACRAERGLVIGPKNQKATYGALTKAASTLTPPEKVTLKPQSACRLLGRPIARLDQGEKVTGAAQYGIDVRLPGMVYAAIAQCPAFGGKLASVDPAPAMKVGGVRQVVRLDDAVAVIGDHTFAAVKGLKSLQPVWDFGPGAADDSAGLLARMDKASLNAGVPGTKTGDAAAALAGARRRLEATYQLPLLAHATMEPLNCTVLVGDGAAEVWVGTQSPVRARDAIARAAGVAADKVTVHPLLLGGGFGRRLHVDFIAKAGEVARQVPGKPVKVTWTREEDIRHDRYRPCYFDRLAAGLDETGRILAWSHRTCAGAVSWQWDPTSLKDGLDSDAVDTAAGIYGIDNVLTDYVRLDPGQVPLGWWRGVGPTHNLFMVESFIDELAAAAGADPLAFRLKHLGAQPRAAAVLQAAAKAAGWGTPLPPGRGRGVSLCPSFGSFLAEVAEVAVAADGKVKVDKVTCAVDCGRIVNPDTIRAQVEGGINFGLTAALWGEVTLDKGRIVQSNFNDYRPMRISEAPVVETVIIASDEASGGIGEPPCSATAPALANAIFAATGKRLRKLPIGTQLKA